MSLSNCRSVFVSIVISILSFHTPVIWAANGMTVGMKLETENLTIEVISGDFDHPVEDLVESIADFQSVEVFEFDIQSTLTQADRNPALVLKTPREFFDSVLQVSREKTKPIHRFGKISLKGAYLKHSRHAWTLFRVVATSGIRLASFLAVGMGLSIGAPLALATMPIIALPGLFFNKILWFMNKARIYNLIPKGAYPRLDAHLADPLKKASIDRIHSTVNWGFLDAIFSVLFLGSYNAALIHLGLPPDLPTPWEFALAQTTNIASQYLGDRAVSRYKDLLALEDHFLNLDPVTKEKMIDALGYKWGAIVSVTSVIGFTSAASNSIPLNIVGYSLLLGLGTISNHVEKKLDEKIRLRLHQISLEEASCGFILVPKERW